MSDDAHDPSVSDAPSRAPPGTFITLDDAKELLSHITSSMKYPEHSHPPDITRGYTPKWEHGKDNFKHFEHNVELYMKRHNIFHLLRSVPSQSEESVHAQAVMVITGQLKREDQRAVRNMTRLCTIWEFLVRKYHPSIEADQVRLLRLWEKCQKGNRSVKEYHSDIISLEEQLAAHDHEMPRFLVLDKLFACGADFELARAAVESTCKHRQMSYFEIMGDYVAYEERRGLHRSFRSNNDSRKPNGQRNSGAGNGGGGGGGGAGGAPILAVKDKPQQHHTCFNCGKQGHMEVDCPDLPEPVKEYLRKQKKRRDEARKNRGSRRR